MTQFSVTCCKHVSPYLFEGLLSLGERLLSLAGEGCLPGGGGGGRLRPGRGGGGPALEGGSGGPTGDANITSETSFRLEDVQ